MQNFFLPAILAAGALAGAEAPVTTPAVNGTELGPLPVNEGHIRSRTSPNNTEIRFPSNAEGRWTISWAQGARSTTFVILSFPGQPPIVRSVRQIINGNSGPVVLRSSVIRNSGGRRSLRLALPPNTAPRGTQGQLTITGPGTFDFDPIYVL